MSGVEEGAAIVGLVGVGMDIYGKISGANAQKEAAQKDAALKGQQADEMMSREAINEQIMRDQGNLLEKNYGASVGAAQSGGIGGVMQIHQNTLQNIANSRRDAEFKAQMLRAGAGVENQLASDNLTAAYISGARSLLSTGAKAYSIYKGPGAPKDFS